jgi:hypothetical protein
VGAFPNGGDSTVANANRLGRRSPSLSQDDAVVEDKVEHLADRIN